MIKRIIHLAHQSVTENLQGPVWRILSTCNSYGLLETVLDAIMNGDYMSITMWKKMVKERVLSQDIKSVKVTSKLYKSLELVNNDIWNSRTMLAWWFYAKCCPWDVKKCRVIVRLLLNCYRLGKQRCILCMDGNKNDVRHILFQCTSLMVKRSLLWANVISECPKQLGIEIENMDAEYRCKFILCALNCEFVAEWLQVYKSLMNFVYIMYSSYHTQVADL